jgi:hypothetical protein
MIGYVTGSAFAFLLGGIFWNSDNVPNFVTKVSLLAGSLYGFWLAVTYAGYIFKPL